MGSIFPRELATSRAIFSLIKVEILRGVLRPVISEIGGSLRPRFYGRPFRLGHGEKIKAKRLVAVSLLIQLGPLIAQPGEYKKGTVKEAKVRA